MKLEHVCMRWASKRSVCLVQWSVSIFVFNFDFLRLHGRFDLDSYHSPWYNSSWLQVMLQMASRLTVSRKTRQLLGSKTWTKTGANKQKWKIETAVVVCGIHGIGHLSKIPFYTINNFALAKCMHSYIPGARLFLPSLTRVTRRVTWYQLRVVMLEYGHDNTA